MFERRHLLGVFGIAALLAGFLVFGSSTDFSTNWVRWVFGPLLWFFGFALVVGWGIQLVANLGRKQQEEKANRLAKSALPKP